MPQDSDIANTIESIAPSLRQTERGADYPPNTPYMPYIGVIFAQQGKHDLALDKLNEALTIRSTALGADHVDVSMRLNLRTAMGGGRPS